MTVFWLIRHGQSIANRGESHISPSPATIPLTDLGEAQAQRVASAFAEAPDLIVTSAYLRTERTAQPTMERFPDVPYEEWYVEEITFLSPVRYAHTTVEQRRPPAKIWWETADPLLVDGEGAESYTGFMERADWIIDRLDKTHHPFVAVFSHETFIQAVMWRVLRRDQPIDSADMTAFRAYSESFSIPNCSIVKLRTDGSDIWVSGILMDHLA